MTTPKLILDNGIPDCWEIGNEMVSIEDMDAAYKELVGIRDKLISEEKKKFRKDITIIEGLIEIGYDGDHDCALKVGGRVLADEAPYHKNVSIRYWVSDVRKSLVELEMTTVKTFMGLSKAKYCHTYSDYTGYLWTDEDWKVGGHDLLREIRNYVGKYLYLEVSY